MALEKKKARGSAGLAVSGRSEMERWDWCWQYSQVGVENADDGKERSKAALRESERIVTCGGGDDGSDEEENNACGDCGGAGSGRQSVPSEVSFRTANRSKKAVYDKSAHRARRVCLEVCAAPAPLSMPRTAQK